MTNNIRVRAKRSFYPQDFLARVFREICQHEQKDGRFAIGKSLSWKAYQTAASRTDLAELCTKALDFREPNIRPDRQRFAAFRLSLGARLLDQDLPFTRDQLCILGDSLIMSLKTEYDAFPIDRVGRLLKGRVEAL